MPYETPGSQWLHEWGSANSKNKLDGRNTKSRRGHDWQSGMAPIERLSDDAAYALTVVNKAPLAPPHSPPQRPRSPDSSKEAKVKRMWSLDDFDVGWKLGEGRFGKIYLAREKTTKCAVVLKCLSKDMIRLHGLAHQVQREVELQKYAGRCQRHILRLFAYFWDDVHIFLVLEYADGGSLQNLLDSRAQHRFSEDEVRNILRQLMSALMFLHERDIIHRDLKPDNILFKRQEVRLADFSWAVLLDRNDVARNRRYTLCGTLDYLSPELVSKRGCNTKADMWSLGVLTYRMLCGCSPFERCSTSEVCFSITRGDVQYPAHLTPEARNFIASLLCVDESKRFTCREAMQHPFVQNHTHNPCDTNVSTMKLSPFDELTTMNCANLEHAAVSLPLIQSATVNPESPSSLSLFAQHQRGETRGTMMVNRKKNRHEQEVGRSLAASRRPSASTESISETFLSGMSFVTVSSSHSTECIPNQQNMSATNTSSATHTDWLMSVTSGSGAVTISSSSAAAVARAGLSVGKMSKNISDDVGMSSYGASQSRPRTHCSVSDGSCTLTVHHHAYMGRSPVSSIHIVPCNATAASPDDGNEGRDNVARTPTKVNGKEEEGANCAIRLRFDDDDYDDDDMSKNNNDCMSFLSQFTAVSASTINASDDIRSRSITPLFSPDS